jgi:hypothetical protein
MGAKISLLLGTGETDPQGFYRVTLGSTRASAAGIGCQLIVRRRRHAARGSGQAPVHTRFTHSRAARNSTPLSQRGATVKYVVTCQMWHRVVAWHIQALSPKQNT